MGCPEVTIGSLCQKTGVRDPRKNPDGEFRYVDIASIDRDTKSIGEPTILLGKVAPSRARKVIKHRDVLVATVRPNLNAVAQVPAVLDDQIASTGFAVLRPDESRLSSDYLYQWTKMPAFIAQLMGKVRGAQYPAVSDGDVFAATIPLPPIEEQRRIANLLDEADRLQRLRKEANEKAQRILPALFVEMFGDPETNPMGWEVKPLGATGSTVRYGMSVPPSPSPSGTPMLRATDFSRGVIDGSSLVRVDISTVPESKRFLLDSSDVIVVRSGAYTGDVAQVTSEFASCLAGYDLVVSPSPVVIPEYLEQYLLLPQIQEGYFKPQSARSGQPHLNSKQLLATPLILPSVKAQERFADAVAGVRAVRKNGVLAQNAISSLRKTLGSRLFAEVM